MNTKQKANIWGVFAGTMVVLSALILLLPVGAEAHCNGKHAGNPGCEDPHGDPAGGDSEIFVKTTFNCPISTAAGLSCPALGIASLFQADGIDATYEHDLDNVVSAFNDKGYFVLSMHKRQNRFGTRNVWWSFPMRVDFDGKVDFESVFAVSGTDDLDGRGIDHKTVIQVGKFTNVDLRALAPGVPEENVDMLLDLYLDTGKKNNDILFVRYSPTENGQCPGPRSNSGATVTRTDDGMGGPGTRTWTIVVEAGETACMYTIAGIDYGDFDFGPLVLSVTELP